VLEVAARTEHARTHRGSIWLAGDWKNVWVPTYNHGFMPITRDVNFGVTVSNVGTCLPIDMPPTFPVTHPLKCRWRNASHFQ